MRSMGEGLVSLQGIGERTSITFDHQIMIYLRHLIQNAIMNLKVDDIGG